MPIVLDGSTGITLPTGVQVSSLTLATAQTASGTSVNFTGIPSWVKRITVTLNLVSTSGASFLIFQLGTNSGVLTSGYNTMSAALTGTAQGVSVSTAGYLLRGASSAASSTTGQLILTKVTGNTWSGLGIFQDTADNRQIWSTGGITLTEPLIQIRLTTVNGTDTFDAGTINIMYE